MQVREYLNSNNDIALRENNIFIPICLGNKFFSEKGVLNQNVNDYLDWAIANTKEKVLFLVVDKIQNTNFYVRNNHKSEKASTTRVLEEGEILKGEIEKLIQKLPKDKQEMVDVIKWEDYQNSDPLWAQITHIVYKEFKNNPDFMKAVLAAVKTSVIDRKFSEEDYLRLCDYVLDEFCVVYSGITYKNTYFGVYPYPGTDSVLDLIEDIKSGKIFSKLSDKLPKEIVKVLILN
jgi:hypothetical protein